MYSHLAGEIQQSLSLQHTFRQMRKRCPQLRRSSLADTTCSNPQARKLTRTS
jgi:hypothetical protein